MIQHPFLTLVEEQSAAINHVCRSFCHTTEDCEDLRQDIIMNLWLGWSRYRPTAKPVTWVWRVAVNTGISWRRHRQRQVDTSPLDGIDLPDDGVDYEERKWLYDLIRQLPAKDQSSCASTSTDGNRTKSGRCWASARPTCRPAF